ncbi:MAG: DHHA1 domain-containing protein, partial [Phycisphaerae bacterium]
APLLERVKKHQKLQSKQDTAGAVEAAEQLLRDAERAGETAIVAGALESATADQMRAASDSVRARAGSAAVLFAAAADGRVVLLAAMTPDLVKRGVKAGDLIREVAPIVGGKGGGRPDMAQGGGSEPGKIGEAIDRGRAWLRAKLA